LNIHSGRLLPVLVNVRLLNSCCWQVGLTLSRKSLLGHERIVVYVQRRGSGVCAKALYPVSDAALLALANRQSRGLIRFDKRVLGFPGLRNWPSVPSGFNQLPANVICHGRGRGFEPRRPRHITQANKGFMEPQTGNDLVSPPGFSSNLKLISSIDMQTSGRYSFVGSYRPPT